MSAAPAAAAARGPLAFLLRSQSGQWMVVGLGSIYAFPEQARSFLVPMLDEVGLGNFANNLISNGLLKSDQDSTTNKEVAAAPTPIIIHAGGSSGDSDRGVVATVTKYAIGAGACWVGFIVLSNSLPDFVQEMMPVTRSFFGKTSKFLARSIVEVQKVLEDKIAVMTKKQDTLERKLDGTHDSVKSVQTDLGETRVEISQLGDSLERCEDTLTSSNRLQSYTSKGVTLLVRCVASMLPSNDRQVNELAQYIQDGEDLGRKGMLSPPSNNSSSQPKAAQQQQEPKTNFLIRDSQVDDDLCSLEDVQSLLGFGGGPNALLAAK
eukprot:CAMPEP_0113495780 /NCGR_PEP_ID=MMETSP0014_2-20120614/29783_1 /TAXON_ID=2857 /ORGANISM="Nitzschia sp." /LENGTH=320 /DNA_ID=CAMNT_0000389683 /DNA_START=149 /DNA_END=1111 /DNA_ORIENTATION=+ /assembly_acc=CAM_ASM_000159